MPSAPLLGGRGRYLRPLQVIAEGPHPLLSRRRCLLVRRGWCRTDGSRSHIRGSLPSCTNPFPRGQLLFRVARISSRSATGGPLWSCGSFGRSECGPTAHVLGLSSTDGLWPSFDSSPKSITAKCVRYLGSGKASLTIGRVLTVLQSASLPGLPRPVRSFDRCRCPAPRGRRRYIRRLHCSLFAARRCRWTLLPLTWPGRDRRATARLSPWCGSGTVYGGYTQGVRYPAGYRPGTPPPWVPPGTLQPPEYWQSGSSGTPPAGHWGGQPGVQPGYLGWVPQSGNRAAQAALHGRSADRPVWRMLGSADVRPSYLLQSPFSGTAPGHFWGNGQLCTWFLIGSRHPVPFAIGPSAAPPGRFYGNGQVAIAVLIESVPAPVNIACNRRRRRRLQADSGESASYLLLCSLDPGQLSRKQSRPSAASPGRSWWIGQIPIAVLIGNSRRWVIYSGNRQSRDCLQAAFWGKRPVTYCCAHWIRRAYQLLAIGAVGGSSNDRPGPVVQVGIKQCFGRNRPKLAGIHHFGRNRSSPRRPRLLQTVRTTESPAYSAGLSSVLTVLRSLGLWLPSLQWPIW